MSMSDFLENAGLNAIYRNTAHPAPPVGTWVGLFTADPTDAGTGSEVPTLNTGYARVKINVDGVTIPYWSLTEDDGAGGRQVKNVQAFDYPEALLDWGTIGWFGTFDAATGGNLLDHAPLTTPRVIVAGDVPRFKAGILKIQRR